MACVHVIDPCGNFYHLIYIYYTVVHTLISTIETEFVHENCFAIILSCLPHLLVGQGSSPNFVRILCECYELIDSILFLLKVLKSSFLMFS